MRRDDREQHLGSVNLEGCRNAPSDGCLDGLSNAEQNGQPNRHRALKLDTWKDSYAKGVIALWNREAVAEGYKELNQESLARIFTDSPYFDPLAAFVLLDGEQVTGFACGCTGDDLPLGDKAGYLTCMVVDGTTTNGTTTSDHPPQASDSGASRDHEFVLREHVSSRDASAIQTAFRLLLDALEERFIQLGKAQAEVLFFNPMRLPWYIPDTPGHEHNNAPGVPSGSVLHCFLLEQGYVERATEQAMYMELTSYAIPDEILAKEAAAERDGYIVAVSPPVRVDFVAVMLSDLGNPLWTEEIGRCADDGTPVVFAARDGRAVGFAGPVLREASGRGYFAGIGVHPDHEGHGLGTVLFFRLCEALRTAGASYMSLYTGMTNPAARIYEKAGFRTVKTFAVMRKELEG